MATVLTPTNIGGTLEIVTEPGKFNVKIDGTSLVKAADGTLSSVSSSPANGVVSGSFDSATNILTLTKGDATVQNIDLSALDVDVNVSSITDNGNGTYTFNQDDGGPSVTLDLSTMLKQVSTSNSTTVTLTGAGTAGSPLTAVAKISNSANNSLTSDAGGLYAPIETTETLVEFGTNTVLGYIRPV